MFISDLKKFLDISLYSVLYTEQQRWKLKDEIPGGTFGTNQSVLFTLKCSNNIKENNSSGKSAPWGCQKQFFLGSKCWILTKPMRLATLAAFLWRWYCNAGQSIIFPTLQCEKFWWLLNIQFTTRTKMSTPLCNIIKMMTDSKLHHVRIILYFLTSPLHLFLSCSFPPPCFVLSTMQTLWQSWAKPVW